MNAKLYRSVVLLLSIMIGLTLTNVLYAPAISLVSSSSTIKWVDFEIPSKAMTKAMDIDIEAHSNGSAPMDWIEVLAILGTKYGGDWKLYKSADMDAVVKRMEEGDTREEILGEYKNYDYFYTAYHSVLGGFLGEFQKEVPDKEHPGQTVVRERYGLKAYHPIAEGYGYNHYRDFGDSRSYGYRRGHTGNDLCGSLGTPIVAVEAGTVEELGWNQYGGWRVGVRSFDQRRYYYYAHLRKNHPFVPGLEVGSQVQAGDVIGYLGMTGYSKKENVDNMEVPHLHFGVQLIFDESQKDGDTQIWIDVYDIIEVLEKNRTTVERVEETKDYVRKYKLYDERVPYQEEEPKGKDKLPRD